MATRLYLAKDLAPGVNPPFNSVWEDTATSVRRSMVVDKIPGDTLAPSAGITIAIGPDALDRQYVSDPIVAQVFGGTLTALIAGVTNAVPAAVGVRLYAYVVSNDGLTFRGQLVDSIIGTVPGTLQSKYWANGVAVAAVNALDGDRVVCEIGFVGGIGDSFNIEVGADDAEPDFTAEGQTDDLGWIEFSQDVTFQIVTVRNIETATDYYNESGLIDAIADLPAAPWPAGGYELRCFNAMDLISPEISDITIDAAALTPGTPLRITSSDPVDKQRLTTVGSVSSAAPMGSFPGTHIGGVTDVEFIEITWFDGSLSDFTGRWGAITIGEGLHAAQRITFTRCAMGAIEEPTARRGVFIGNPSLGKTSDISFFDCALIGNSVVNIEVEDCDNFSFNASPGFAIVGGIVVGGGEECLTFVRCNGILFQNVYYAATAGRCLKFVDCNGIVALNSIVIGHQSAQPSDDVVLFDNSYGDMHHMTFHQIGGTGIAALITIQNMSSGLRLQNNIYSFQNGVVGEIYRFGNESDVAFLKSIGNDFWIPVQGSDLSPGQGIARALAPSTKVYWTIEEWRTRSGNDLAPPGFNQTGSVQADPLFIDSGDPGDPRISSGSPAQNIGIALGLLSDFFDANARAFDAYPDAGAFELQVETGRNWLIWRLVDGQVILISQVLSPSQTLTQRIENITGFDDIIAAAPEQ